MTLKNTADSKKAFGVDRMFTFENSENSNFMFDRYHSGQIKVP